MGPQGSDIPFLKAGSSRAVSPQADEDIPKRLVNAEASGTIPLVHHGALPDVDHSPVEGANLHSRAPSGGGVGSSSYRQQDEKQRELRPLAERTEKAKR